MPPSTDGACPLPSGDRWSVPSTGVLPGPQPSSGGAAADPEGAESRGAWLAGGLIGSPTGPHPAGGKGNGDGNPNDGRGMGRGNGRMNRRANLRGLRDRLFRFAKLNRLRSRLVG